jgi:F0F1-type ATP synthase gamma subunit
LGLTDQEVVIQQKHLITLGLGLGTLGGFLFKQFNTFKNRKIQFMKTLTDSLYFKNLDNNQGVFHHLIDAAEEEEFKEAMLAYYFLITEHKDLNMESLDQVIEEWFREKLNCPMDFEVNDAIDKLLRLNLVEKQNGFIKAKSLKECNQILDNTWDNYFDHKVSDGLL